jgi:hypothetical protein
MSARSTSASPGSARSISAKVWPMRAPFTAPWSRRSAMRWTTVSSSVWWFSTVSQTKLASAGSRSTIASDSARTACQMGSIAATAASGAPDNWGCDIFDIGSSSGGQGPGFALILA